MNLSKNDFVKNNNETDSDFIIRIGMLKDAYGLTWQDICSIINDELGYNFKPDKYRKDFAKYVNSVSETVNNITPISTETNDELDAIQIERYKLADERSQINAMYRRMAREDTLKEIADNAVSKMNSKFMLDHPNIIESDSNKLEAMLLISDWHIGIDINNIFNVFNVDIAKNRINQLQNEVIKKCKAQHITDLTVINLGDLIAGNIHLPIRLNSRIDVITQTMEVSELLAEFINNLSNYFNIKLYSVLDNHSRIDPNKDTSLQLESLARVIHWYVKSRLETNKNVKVYDNTIDENIATLEIKNHKIICVHGDLDKQSKIVERLTAFTQDQYDLVVSAHMHHFSADEQNNTMVICNGSLMGTDDYAFKLRLNSKPSQTLIMVSDKSPCEEIHRIILD